MIRDPDNLIAVNLPDKTNIGTHMENVAYELNLMRSNKQIYSWGSNWGVDKDKIDVKITIMASGIYEEIAFVFPKDQIKTISDVVIGRIRQLLSP